MTTLHMETDNVRALASQLKQAAESMRQQTQSLNSSTQSIDWQGPSRDEFVMETEALIRQLDAQSEAGVVLAGRLESEVAEWEQISKNLSGDNFNSTTPTPGSLAVGGDGSTVDDHLAKKFGRDVNLVDGTKKWKDYEVAAVDRAVEKLPNTLVKKSQIKNFYRDDEHPTNKDVAGMWSPSTKTVYMYKALPDARQGGDSESERFESVLYHEMVHSAQFDKDGNPISITQDYISKFGWSYDGKWHYSGKDSEFPGDGENTWSWKILGWRDVSYPKKDRNPYEDMAEAVTYYRYESATLKNNSPERYEWVKQNIFEGKEY